MPTGTPMTRQLSLPKAAWLGTALLLAAASAAGQTRVDDAWIRGTVAQQSATGMFARITSVGGGRLVAVSSPIAGHAEIHEMSMTGDLMRMRPVAGVDLPPGQPVELKAGGHHIMLMDLKQALKAGDKLPVTLVVESAGGRREQVELQVPVRALGSAATKP